MADRPVLAYRAEAPTPKLGRAVLLVALVILPVLIYLLFELQRLPYRPPQDMSTLLGGSEIAAVRVLIGVLAVGWLSCAAAVARRCRS